MIIEIKALVEKINPAYTKSGNGKETLVQTIILKVPGYVDQFGDKKGDDEYFEATLFNDKIKKLNLDPYELEGAKVKAKCFLNSNYYKEKNTYILNLLLHTLEVV